MNANPKLDVHPDAETLNAFAEQVLAEKERGQIMTHLAECGRCRLVVYLAQEAAAEMVPPVATAAVPLEGRRESWFRSWRFALVPVAALAGIVALAYMVHVQRVETGSEMAKITPQTAPQNAGSNSGSPTQAIGVAAAPDSAGPPKSETRARKKASASAGSAPLLPPFSAAMATTVGANEPADAVREEPALPPGASGIGYSTLGSAAKLKRGPAVAAGQKEQERAAATAEFHGMAATTMAQASENMSAKHEEADRVLTAAAPQFEASPPPPASFEAGNLTKVGGVSALYKAKEAGLPSGLAAVSTVSAQKLVLALDKAGSVFLSEDSGGHWENVVRQWSGRAVAVRTQPAEQTIPSSATPSYIANFEIVNDQGQVWVSTNGRTWKAK
jgi:hypothetical protein